MLNIIFFYQNLNENLKFSMNSWIENLKQLSTLEMAAVQKMCILHFFLLIIHLPGNSASWWIL